MKKRFLYSIFLVLALIVSGWAIAGGFQPQEAAAQGSDVDTILAQATVKGYLLSLSRGHRSLTLANFYLAEEVAGSPVAQNLSSQQIDAFEVVEEQWPDDNLYRATVTISPGNRVLILDVSRINARWRIVNLAWGDGTPVPQKASPTTQDSTTTNLTVSTAVTGLASTAEVLSAGLNVRAGPGLTYPVQSVLNQGDQVEIVGINPTKEWYQVAQDGQVIGWISASPTYVSTSSDSAELPTVSPPAGAVIPGTLILQTHSGGDFYLVEDDGTSLRYIASGIDPALSPDGSKVAFTRWGSGEVGTLWIHDLTTGEERPVLGETPEAKSPTWSPDGSKIVINFQHGGRLNVEQRCKDRGSPIPPDAYDINTGSESGRICYKLPADTHWQLRLVDVNTGAYEDLPSATYSFAPTWDPANDWRVVFAASTGLQQLDLNRDEYFPFTTDLRDRGPVFSPDGSQVAVTYKQHDHWEVYTIDTADGTRHRLTKVSILDEPYNSAAPAWSPDDQQIAFVTDRTGQWEFWLMNADGSNPRPLLPSEVAAQLPVEYRGVDERLISWVASPQSGTDTGPTPALDTSEAQLQPTPEVVEDPGSAVEDPRSVADGADREETSDADLPAKAAPSPDFLPVTGWGMTLPFSLVFLVVIALCAKGIYSIKN
jgi:TolB protein